MESLFATPATYPEGFQYFAEFLDLTEANALIERIEKIDLHTFTFQGYEAKRRVASFGFDYSFEKNILRKGKEIPLEFNFIIEKVAAHVGVDKSAFKELLITEYPAGSVINWHRDAFPFDIIAGISLLSDCTFRLRPYDRSKQNKASVVSVPVKSNSLYLISGKARTDWQHSITPVKSKRYSITLRTLKDFYR